MTTPNVDYLSLALKYGLETLKMFKGFGMNTEESSLPQPNGNDPLIASRFLPSIGLAHVSRSSGPAPANQGRLWQFFS
jgi:hypothetical protein